MDKIDMSAEAVTTRLKRVSQLRRLGFALKQAKIKGDVDRTETDKSRREPSSNPDTRKDK
jgi:hypothetical protein